jgi:hypothetical protein
MNGRLLNTGALFLPCEAGRTALPVVQWIERARRFLGREKGPPFARAIRGGPFFVPVKEHFPLGEPHGKR